jgi:hypothetical protein
MRSPRKTSKNLANRKTVGSNLNSMKKSQTLDESIDDEVIANSQDIMESKLKRKFKEHTLRKSGIASIPQKDDLPDLPKEPMSILNDCDVNSFEIKEEIIEMDDNIHEGSIEMTHDLSELIINTSLSSNILDYSSPIISNNNNIKTIDDTDSPDEIQMQDPLFIDMKYHKPNKKLKTKGKRKVLNNQTTLDSFISEDKNYKSNDNSFNNQNLKQKAMLNELSEEFTTVSLFYNIN